MKNITIPRGKGKTTRMIALSEFTGATIICYDEVAKQYILQMAARFDYKIPPPVTVANLLEGHALWQRGQRQFLVDEAPAILSRLIASLTNSNPDCVLATTTSNER